MMRTWVLVMLLVSTGCWSSGPRVRLDGPVQVFDLPQGVDEYGLKKALRSRVAALPGVGSSGRPVQLLASFERQLRVVEEEAQEEFVLRLGFKPLERETQDLQLSASASGPAPGALLEPALEAFSSRWAMRRGSDGAVIQSLESEEQGLRWAASEEAGRRRLPDAVVPMARRLESESTTDEEALGLITALVAIGDVRAAPALIEATNRRNPLVWPPVLFGLSQLGGRQAEGFLFTVAQGHPNPDVRRRARLALDEISRTEDSPSE
ncbi:MAG: hypothetical protein AAGD10_05245 [Myxococcota bacterium]